MARTGDSVAGFFVAGEGAVIASGQPGHFPNPTGETDMPDPGTGNPDFGRPTANPGRGPRRGRMARKGPRPPIKVPGEYAEFRLEDGRHLRMWEEVGGEMRT